MGKKIKRDPKSVALVLITILKCIEMKENYQYKKTQSKKIVNLN